MKLSLIIILTLFSSSIMAEDVGFAAGNIYTPVYLSGNISIQCSSSAGHDSTIHRCFESYVTPVTHSKFLIKTDVEADNVVLKAIHEDGSTKSKKSKFDSKTGLSKKRFNLWIRTLLQRPLLELGKNIVEYTLTKKGIVVEKGEFIVETESITRRSCRRGSYHSGNLSDCRTPSSICSRYFREYNYCR